MRTDFVTVVFAGGEGRRMGGDKPARLLEGRTLLDHALEIARSQGGAVAVAVRAPAQVGHRRDVPLLGDRPDCQGPLAGLISAVSFAEERGATSVLTMPCDAPRLPADLWQRLHEAMGEKDQSALAQSCGRLHPACALWRTSIRSTLEAYRQAGGASLKGLAAAAGMAVADWGEIDPDPFVNLNTPADLAKAEACSPLFAPIGTPEVGRNLRARQAARA